MSTARSLQALQNSSSETNNLTLAKDPAPTLLVQHMGVFADNGTVTTASVTAGFKKLHYSDSDAASNAQKIMFVGGLSTKWCPFASFTPQQGLAIIHPRHSGIYNKDGSFNKERWDLLLTFAEELNGKQVVRKARMFEFLELCKTKDNAWDLIGMGKTASNLEWENAYEKFTTDWKANTDGTYEACISVDTLDMFYNKPVAAFKLVEDQVLPVAMPSTAPRPR